MSTESTSTSNYDNSLKELNLMIANLEAKNQMLQGKVENFELKAQTLQGKVEILELKAENRAFKENAERKALEAKANEFAMMLAEQQKKMLTQFQAQNNYMMQKMKEEAELEMNEFEESIQKQMEKFRKEMIGTKDINQMKLDYIWGQLMILNQKIPLLANPKGIVWNVLNTNARISKCGLKASNDEGQEYVFATKGYTISGEQCRKDHFPFTGTIKYYFEVTPIGCYLGFEFGFTDGSEHARNYIVGGSLNSYGIASNNTEIFWLSGKKHKLVCPIKVIDDEESTFGFGILLNSKNKLAIFFTVNGILWKIIPIKPTVDRLYPTVCLYGNLHGNTSVEGNFGDNLVAKPFIYDIDQFQGLDFE